MTTKDEKVGGDDPCTTCKLMDRCSRERLACAAYGQYLTYGRWTLGARENPTAEQYAEVFAEDDVSGHEDLSMKIAATGLSARKISVASGIGETTIKKVLAGERIGAHTISLLSLWVSQGMPLRQVVRAAAGPGKAVMS